MSEARNDRTSGEWETLRPVENPEPPMLADRYRVVRRLGEGGMGSVWLAEDTKLDNRKVAVKMLPAVLAGKKAACRLVKQEALTAMKLSHPNIATVRTFEEDAGNPFLVMDYIEGRGLDDILGDQGALPEAVALKLLAPVAAALDYAHGKGVVHRDVKPGNVIVRKDGTPFVLDFGIAREIQETVTRMTGRSPGGTLLYMSPEQLHGRAPAPAQDVYSFAAMAYECLNGAPPFTRGKVEYQIDQDAPAPLEAGTASPELRAGIMAGLAKKPEDRPATCEEVLGLGEPARRARKAREAEEAMLRRQEANRLARKRAWEKYAKELEAKALEEERAERKLAEAQARKKREEALARALEALEQRKARVRREGWTLLLSVLAVVLAVAWWMERQKVLKDWDWKHKAACGLAKSFDYSEALDMLDEIQPKWLFCLGTNRHAAVREAWSTLAGPQRDLQNGAKKEKDARKVLIDLENAKKALYESRKSLAEEAWKDYQTERAKTEAKRAEIQMNENGDTKHLSKQSQYSRPC